LVGEVAVDEIGGVSRMVGRVGRAHASAATAMLHDLGLYPGQELLLMRLWETDHQTQAELTAALGLDPSTVTRTVQCLERQGLLHRTPSSTDRRRHRSTATARQGVGGLGCGGGRT